MREMNAEGICCEGRPDTSSEPATSQPQQGSWSRVTIVEKDVGECVFSRLALWSEPLNSSSIPFLTVTNTVEATTRTLSTGLKSTIMEGMGHSIDRELSDQQKMSNTNLQ